MRSLLAALLLTLPGLAGAEAPDHSGAGVGLPAAAARASAASAIEMAEGNAKRMASFPEEFIALTIMYPYGSEDGFLKNAGDSVPELSAGLAQRAAYWKAVRRALRGERHRVKADLHDASLETIGALVKADCKLGRELQAAVAITEDIAKDAVLVKSIDKKRHPETSDQLYKRKTDLFEKLKSLK